MEFKAEVIDGELVVKPIIERKGNDVTIHVPALHIIAQTKAEYQLRENNGKRNI